MTTLRSILEAYAHIDKEELGEDKFMGHHDIDQTQAAIIALIEECMTEALPEKRYSKPAPPRKKHYRSKSCIIHEFKNFRCVNCGGVQASYSPETGNNLVYNQAIDDMQARTQAIIERLK